jgi:20S proteasome alpha/beta subunit
MAETTTIITALKYEGGVILCSDSQATDRVAQVRWPVEKPIQVQTYPCVVGMSGSLGMIDQVKDDLLKERWHTNMFRKRDLVRDGIDRSFIKVYKAIEDRNRHIDLWGLSVYWAEGSAHILEHETSGDCCFHGFFHAIGSGSNTAYAIYRTLGGKRLVDVNEQKAIQVSLRILRTCIGVEPMGVSEPFSLWVVNGTGSRKLSEDQIQAELQYVDEWEESERQAFFSA